MKSERRMEALSFLGSSNYFLSFLYYFAGRIKGCDRADYSPLFLSCFCWRSLPGQQYLTDTGDGTLQLHWSVHFTFRDSESQMREPWWHNIDMCPLLSKSKESKGWRTIAYLHRTDDCSSFVVLHSMQTSSIWRISERCGLINSLCSFDSLWNSHSFHEDAAGFSLLVGFPSGSFSNLIFVASTKTRIRGRHIFMTLPTFTGTRTWCQSFMDPAPSKSLRYLSSLSCTTLLAAVAVSTSILVCFNLTDIVWVAVRQFWNYCRLWILPPSIYGVLDILWPVMCLPLFTCVERPHAGLIDARLWKVAAEFWDVGAEVLIFFFHASSLFCLMGGGW